MHLVYWDSIPAKLTCYFSRNDGQSWSRTKVISNGGGYSDVAALPDRTFVVLYEQSRAAGLYLARFRLTRN